MPKVKILLTQDVGYGDYEDSCSTALIREGIADWEEITTDELTYLRQNVYRMKKFKADNTGVNNYSPMIVVQDEIPVRERIKSIRAEIAEEKAREAAAAAIRAEKKAEQTRKRLAKEAEKKKVEMSALIAEHGEEKANTIWEFLQSGKSGKKTKKV
jgi:hypothetical protein